MTKPSVQELNGRVLASTPTDRAHFFGFYDICPWSYDDDRLVLLACEADLLYLPAGEAADVCLWEPGSGRVQPIGRTFGWNFQHGARTQWLRNGNILFNDVADERQCARIVRTDGVLERTLETSVAALSPDETFGVTPNYARLADLYPGYGYHLARNEHIDRGDARGDGLWRVDMGSGSASLLLTFRDLCDRLGLRFSPKMFVTHPVFSPSGDKICFFLIEEREGNSHFMWLLVYDVRSNALNLVNSDKNSHATWLDDERLMVWSRCSTAVSLVRRSKILSVPGVRMLARTIRKWQGIGRNLALSEGFHIFDLAHANRKMLMSPALLPEDGHPSKHPSREVVLCDTYPDASGYLTLFLYSLESKKRVDIARIYHGVKTSKIDLRCDLHPRWNRLGDRVCVDYCEDGVRRSAVIDPGPALAAL